MCNEAVSADGMLSQPLKVPTKKLLCYAGKCVNTWYLREVKNWFAVMGGTHIVGEAYNARTKGYEAIGSGVFDTYIMRGHRTKEGMMAATNEVYLSQWFLQNYEAKYFRRLDLTFYNSLSRRVSKALIPLLESGWYAASGDSYRKSYNALCDEFLLQNRKFESRIKGQLDPAHRELRKAGFLKSWEYKKSGEHDFIISWAPGKKWFEDQKLRTKRKIPHKQLSDQDEQIMENRKAFERDRITENFDRVRRDLGRKMGWQEDSGRS